MKSRLPVLSWRRRRQNMTDLEINKALALAIGWQEHQIDAGPFNIFVCTHVATLTNHAEYRLFNYGRPDVIWPIAEWYNAFPYALRGMTRQLTGKWCVQRHMGTRDYYETIADTAAKAVALTVIAQAQKARAG
jgi:hypothetical protein